MIAVLLSTSMFLLTLLALFLSLVLTLPLPATPLTLGVWILSLSITTSCLICLTLSSWIRIIVILIYIGGLNVLFAYFIATMPNQHLFSKPLFNSQISLFFLILSNFLFMKPAFLFRAQTNLAITKLSFGFNRAIFLFIALILFLALIAVVKIASRHNGPLRPFTL